jgi:hypothetical protein
VAESVLLDADEGRLTLACHGERVLGCEPMRHVLVRENRPSSFVHVVTASRFRLVAVELSEHDAEPLRLEGFEDVVEFSVETPSGLALVNSPGENWRTITQRDGDLRVRVHVRGRDDAVHAQGETDPGIDANVVLETYAIQVWPAPRTDFAVVHLRSEDAASLLNGPATAPLQADDGVEETEERTAAGIAAGNWVGQALTSPLTRPTGAVNATVYLPGTPRKVARRFGTVTGWLGGSRSPADLAVGNASVSSFRSIPGREAALTGQGGYVQLTYTRVDLPNVVEATWNWYLPPPGETHAVWGQGNPVLPTHTTLHLAFDAVEAAASRTRMTLQHSGLPENWCDAMRRFWEWQLSTLPRRSTYR